MTAAVTGTGSSPGAALGRQEARLGHSWRWQVRHGLRDDPHSCCGSGQGSHPTVPSSTGPRSRDTATCSSARVTEGTHTAQKTGPASKWALGGRAAGSAHRAALQSPSGCRDPRSARPHHPSPCLGQPWGSHWLWHQRSSRRDLAAAPRTGSAAGLGRGGGAHPPPGSYKYRSCGTSAQRQAAPSDLERGWPRGRRGRRSTPTPPTPTHPARGAGACGAPRERARQHVRQLVPRGTRAGPAVVPTCDRGEVDADEQGEVGGHVAEDVGLVHVHRGVRGTH